MTAGIRVSHGFVGCRYASTSDPFLALCFLRLRGLSGDSGDGEMTEKVFPTGSWVLVRVQS